MERFFRNTAAILTTASALLFAGNQLPDLLKDIPRDIGVAEQITQFAPNTFLENIVVAENNQIYFSSFIDGKIYTQEMEEEPQLFGEIEGNAAGLAFDSQGGLFVVGNDSEGMGTVFHLNRKGVVTHAVQIEGASHFLNGVAVLNDTTLLIADSERGVIWHYNRTSFEAREWLHHEMLTSPLPDSAGMRIGVNGIALFRETLYAVNTQAMTIVAIPLEKSGDAGEPQIYAENIMGDDLTFDTKGNLYLATHPYNAVVKITPEGERVVIADQIDGMTGCTALKFGYGKRKNQLCVVTNGGLFMPPEGGVRPAKVVRLDIAR